MIESSFFCFVFLEDEDLPQFNNKQTPSAVLLLLLVLLLFLALAYYSGHLIAVLVKRIFTLLLLLSIAFCCADFRFNLIDLDLDFSISPKVYVWIVYVVMLLWSTLSGNACFEMVLTF